MQGITIADWLIFISARADEIQAAVEKLRERFHELGYDSKRNQIKYYFIKAKEGISKVKNVIKDILKPFKTFADKVKKVSKFVLRAFVVVSAAHYARKFATVVRDLAKKTVDLNDNQEYYAGKAGKSVEKYRAEKLALQAMNKTLDEINKDGKLKKQYEDLVKYGESLTFKRADSALTSLSDIGNAFTKLKFVLRLGLAQTYEYFKTFAAEPLKQLKSWLKSWFKEMGYDLDKWPEALAKAMAKALNAILYIGQQIDKTVDFIKSMVLGVVEMFKQSDTYFKAACVVIAAVFILWQKPLIGLSLPFALFILLINDYITWKNGGASFFGDAWEELAKTFKELAGWIKDHFVEAVLIFFAGKKLLKTGIKIVWKYAKEYAKKYGKKAVKNLWRNKSATAEVAAAIIIAKDMYDFGKSAVDDPENGRFTTTLRDYYYSGSPLKEKAASVLFNSFVGNRNLSPFYTSDADRYKLAGNITGDKGIGTPSTISMSDYINASVHGTQQDYYYVDIRVNVGFYINVEDAMAAAAAIDQSLEPTVEECMGQTSALDLGTWGYTVYFNDKEKRKKPKFNASGWNW